MRWDFTEESTHESTEVPFYLPPLFVSPSRLPEFSKTIKEVARKKAALLNETIELQKAMHMKDKKQVEERDKECAFLRLEIESLETKAYAMRNELVKRIYVVVSSVEEMRAVNELWLGTGAGATHGLRCFRGKVYVSVDVREDVIKAIVEYSATSCGLKIFLLESKFSGLRMSIKRSTLSGQVSVSGHQNILGF